MKPTLTSVWRGLHCIALCGFLLAVASPLTAATLTVTNLNDSGPGTLRQAIADAAPGDTINFAVTGIITLTNGELIISTNLGISGPGATNLTVKRNSVQFAPDSRIFKVLAGTVRITDLTIADGQLGDSSGGAGIYNLGTLSLSNVTFSANLSRSGRGGGIHSAGILTLDDCTFLKNVAAGSSAFGGGGIFNSGVFVVRRSLISESENALYAGETGGGIYNDIGGVATIHDTIISSNIVSLDGGGIYNKGTLTVSNCTLLGNIGNVGGGGVRNFGVAKIASSIFAYNTGDNFVGGGVENEGNIVVENCAFYENTAAYGGGIAFWEFAATGSVVNCTFSNNAANRGAGIYIFRGSIAIADCRITGNFATIGSGGGIGVVLGKYSLDSSTVSGNYAPTGGGISDASSDGTILHSVVSENLAFGAPGGGGVAIGSGHSRILESTISSNIAWREGGGIYVYGATTLSNCTIFGNSSTNGGGIRIDGGSVAIFNSIVGGNSVSNGVSGPDCSGTITSQDYNLVQNTNGCSLSGVSIHNIYGLDPQLGSLQYNGGTTWTHALLSNSPAIDAGHSGGLLTDQRGGVRPYVKPGNTNVLAGDGSDIGAFESGGYLRLTSVNKTNNDIRVQFTTDLGHDYHVERRDALGTNAWTSLPGLLPGTGGIMPFVETNAALLPQGFYRVRVD